MQLGDGYVGLLVPAPEVVNNASSIVILPITSIANTFVPSQNLPTPLRHFAEWNPVASVTQAGRELFGNTDPAQGARSEALTCGGAFPAGCCSHGP